jgi:hypothetical protein
VLKKLLPLLAVAIAFACFPVAARAQTHTVTLAWTPGAAVAGVSAASVSFNVYSAPGACASGQTFTKINTSPVTSPTFADHSAYLTSTAVVQTFCYQVTGVAAPVPPATLGVESVPSNQVAASIPAIVPTTPAAPSLQAPVVTSP